MPRRSFRVLNSMPASSRPASATKSPSTSRWKPWSNKSIRICRTGRIENEPLMLSRPHQQGNDMGLLIDGKWHDQWYDTSSTGGRFVRSDARFRNWIPPDGRPGPSGAGGFRAEPGRYHLYVSLACPWAHRTLIMRALKGLEQMISVSVVHPYMGEHGWTFDSGPGVI